MEVVIRLNYTGKIVMKTLVYGAGSEQRRKLD